MWNVDHVIYQVSGYVRGRSMGADQLVHIPGLGHFKIEKICSAADPLRKQTDMVNLSVFI